MVPQAPQGIDKHVQRTMGRLRLSVFMLCQTEREHQLPPINPQTGRRFIRDFTRRFRQAIQQIDMYSMDEVLQNFRRSFGLTTLFFQSLSLDPPINMEELYRRADKFSTMEDNIRAASQTIMITTQNNKPATKGPSEQKNNQAKSQKHPDGQAEKKKDPP